MKIVGRYKYAIQNKDQPMLDLCRQLLDADKFDDAISINKKTDNRTYREHLVPCIMLHNKIIQKIIDKNDDKHIAELIATYLKIAYITTADQKTLDYELNLRTTMPDDWTWGDDVNTRLTFANIEI
jgi:hypothetical protein